MSKKYKLVVFVPTEAAEQVRQAMTQAGAGRLGNYSDASFSSQGIGRFRPLKGADPAIGKVDELEEVSEERIEVLVLEKNIKAVLEAMKQVHPYEEVAYDVYKLENL